MRQSPGVAGGTRPRSGCFLGFSALRLRFAGEAVAGAGSAPEQHILLPFEAVVKRGEFEPSRRAAEVGSSPGGPIPHGL